MTNQRLAWVSITGINPTSPGDVVVYNLQNDKLLAVIPVGVDPRFLKCTPDGSKVYVPNSGSHTLSVISTNSLCVEKVIPTGKAPRTIVIDPSSTRGYVSNYGSNTLSVLDLSTDTLLETIPVGTHPLGLALAKNGPWLYVTNQGDDTLSIVNTETYTLTKTLRVGSRPNGLALTPDETHLYIVNTGDHTVSIFDVREGRVIKTLPVGRVPQKVAIHPSRPFAYVTNFNSKSISVLSTLTHDPITTIDSLVTPNDITLSPDGSQLWITDDYQVTVMDVETLTQKNTLYPPPTAQIRQGISLGETRETIIKSGLESSPNTYHSVPERSVRYVWENVPMVHPHPINFNIQLNPHLHFHRIEKVEFINGEIDPKSVACSPIPLKPHYYRLSFTLKIPYQIFLITSLNQTQKIEGESTIQNLKIEIYIPPNRSIQELDLHIFTKTHLTQEPMISQNNLTLSGQSQVLGIRRLLKVFSKVKPH